MREMPFNNQTAEKPSNEKITKEEDLEKFKSVYQELQDMEGDFDIAEKEKNDEKYLAAEGKIKNKIQTVINDSLDFFESEKNEANFNYLAKKLSILKTGYWENIMDRAWSQEQVDTLMDYFLKYYKRKIIGDDFLFPPFHSFLTTSRKYSDEKNSTNTISDLTAKSLIKTIKDGKSLTRDLTAELRMWFQDIQMMNDELRLNLFSAITNNPRQSGGEAVSREMIRCLMLHDDALVAPLEKLAENNKGNLNKVLKILDILGNMYWFGSFEDWTKKAADRANKIIFKLKEENKNYFVQLRLKMISGDYNQFPETVKGKVSDKYGVHYNESIWPDYFFRLDDPERKELRMEEILKEENAVWAKINGEEKDRIISNYKAIINPLFRKNLEETFKFDLADFNIREQLQFIDFISTKTEEEMKEVIKFIKNSKTKTEKINKFKSFLSLEVDPGDGEKILLINKKLDKSSSDLIFNKIAELADLAAQKNDELNKNFIKKDSDQKIAGADFELLTKAHKIINNFSDKLGDSEIDSAAIEQLLKDLDNNKTEIILLSAIMNSAKNSGQNIELNNLKDVSLEITKNSQTISEEDKKKMINIAEKNWRQNPKLQKTIIEDLNNILAENNQDKFYILRHKDNIIAFLRFEPIDSNVLHVGSFNVENELRGLGIGDEMMIKAVQKESENNILKATVSPRLIAGTSYVEKSGFIIDGYIENYQQTGEPLFSISLDAKKNPTYQSRTSSYEELEKKSLEENDLKNLTGKDNFILKFNLDDDFSKMEQAMKESLVAKNDQGEDLKNQSQKNKYIITRYFSDQKQKNDNIRYFVFEKIN